MNLAAATANGGQHLSEKMALKILEASRNWGCYFQNSALSFEAFVETNCSNDLIEV